MTALLLAMIFLFLSHERLMRWTPLMLWPLVGAMVWQGSPYTGTSLNPARGAGPALAFSDFADLWLYLLAPVLGAVAVVWLRRHPSTHPKTAKLFHDPGYPCSLGSEFPALPVR
jgi:aquaporin Z